MAKKSFEWKRNGVEKQRRSISERRLAAALFCTELQRRRNSVAEQSVETLWLDIWFFLFDNAFLNFLMRHPTLTTILSSVIGAIGGSLLIVWIKSTCKKRNDDRN